MPDAANSEKRAYLKQYEFKPGQSGNPNGRPKKRPVTDYIEEQLKSDVPEAMLTKLKPADRDMILGLLGDRPTLGQFVALRSIQQSLNGDVFALREILDRVEGRVVQKAVLEVNDSMAERLKESRARLPE